MGLCVKHNGRGLCVPDYVRPAAYDAGWSYSQALAGVVEQYKRRHGWVLRALQADGIEFQLADALPDLAPEAAEAALAELQRWLKALPLSRRPLCKARPVL